MFQKRIVVSKKPLFLVHQTNYCGSYLSNATSCDYLCVESISQALVAQQCVKFYYNRELEIPSFINNSIKNDLAIVELALLASNGKRRSVCGLGFFSFHSQGNMKTMFSLMLNLIFKSFVQCLHSFVMNKVWFLLRIMI